MNVQMRRWCVVLVVAGLFGWWSRHQLSNENDRVRPEKGEGFMNNFNRLSLEKSPYLLQHKENPVHWFAWGDEAFRIAREEQKPIFLSVGYSTCHWCHVMEKDSFEQQEVADVMNRSFINIKVDREEHPDVDQIYMDAVVGMTGSGGWPMSVFLTPDLKPFYGGTFFWRDQFLQLLEAIHQAWMKDPSRMQRVGDELVQRLQETGEERIKELPDKRVFDMAFSQLQQSFDRVYGGFGKAPKFPRARSIGLLLRISRRTGNAEALKIAEKTLDSMAYGGIYDHIGGGFHRYATDAQWRVPHFEKMLYDNALLAVAFLEAYQVTGKKSYASVAHETLDYVLRDMTDASGSFFSAEDADSEGVEGKFYLWTKTELQQHLSPEEFALFATTYGIDSSAPLEGGAHILHLAQGSDWSIKEAPLLRSAQTKLFTARERRIHPQKDDKLLTSWNGLMITALAKGYQVLGEEKYLTAAEKAVHVLQKRLFKEGSLLRRYRDGESRFAGTLDDYAFCIAGLIDLYESDFDPSWISWAEELQQKQNALFWDDLHGGYFFTEEESKSLVIRKKELGDGATPSGNAVSALNLQRLFRLTFKQDYQQKALGTLRAMSDIMQHAPQSAESALIALDVYLSRAQDVVVIGKKGDRVREDMQIYLHRTFLPHAVIACADGSEQQLPPLAVDRPMLNGRTTIYVCEGNVCRTPTTESEEAKRLLSNMKN